MFSAINVLFCLYQNKIKELELLCSLKEVPLDFSDLENVVLALRQVIPSLSQFVEGCLMRVCTLTLCFCTNREKFFQEVNSTHIRSSTPLVKTKALVKSLMNRTELLLHVTIAPHCRSLTTTPAGTPGPGTHQHVFIYC